MSTWASQADERLEGVLEEPRLAELLRLHRNSRVNVLLMGGPDEGRAALARAFHEWSPLAAGPFVRMNCRVDEPLVAASLRARLAPASARDWLDPLHACASGTLLLDHVEALSPAAQRMLLAVIGAPWDASQSWVGRLVAGSEHELEDAVQGERFLRGLLDALDKVRWVLGPHHLKAR